VNKVFDNDQTVQVGFILHYCMLHVSWNIPAFCPDSVVCISSLYTRSFVSIHWSFTKLQAIGW